MRVKGRPEMILVNVIKSDMKTADVSIDNYVMLGLRTIREEYRES